MKRRICAVDTNIVSSGLLGSATGPPARILRAMLGGRIPYLMSDDLLAEYSSVLRRPKISRLHGRTSDEVNQILVDLVANAMWCVPVYGDAAPDIGDSHLWALLALHQQGLLVTGDRLFIDNPPDGASGISPRRFADAFLPSNRV